MYSPTVTNSSNCGFRTHLALPSSVLWSFLFQRTESACPEYSEWTGCHHCSEPWLCHRQLYPPTWLETSLCECQRSNEWGELMLSRYLHIAASTEQRLFSFYFTCWKLSVRLKLVIIRAKLNDLIIYFKVPPLQARRRAWGIYPVLHTRIASVTLRFPLKSCLINFYDFLSSGAHSITIVLGLVQPLC